MFEQLYLIFKIALVISFIMFIVYGIVKNCHKRTRAIVFLSVSGGLLIFFVLAFILDKYIFELYGGQLYPKTYNYYFLGISFIYTIISLVMLIKSGKVPMNKKKKMVYTYNDKNEYVYLFYKYEKTVYLLKDTYAGIKYKMKKTEFVDDVVRKINSGMGIHLDEEAERRGIVTVKGGKTDDVFYCFMIELDTPFRNTGFESVDCLFVSHTTALDFDKYIVLKCLSSSDFNEIY